MFKLLLVDCDFAKGLACACPAEMAIGPGDACMLEIGKVPEIGCVAAPLPGEQRAGRDDLPLVLRRATMQDQARASENQLMARSAARKCREKIAQRNMDMRLVGVRYVFDRSKLTVFFTADGYVDFRDLVQDLASEVRTRVEMRQIGVRDAAGMIGGLAPCGRKLCCSVWMKEFDNINIRMAKAQGLSLNPAVINGMCGRIKCCIRYEYNCYLELGREMPPEGSRVECAGGCGCVMARSVLRRKVKVALDDRRVLDLDARDVRVLASKGGNGLSPAADQAEWTDGKPRTEESHGLR
ncbi:MAG: stage 0 sporulation protein [Lentisphaerae bacterium]|mgnify:CR=1 FL=1|nr:stage 0 sporulation protein [Lentisphaerota bacterium]